METCSALGTDEVTIPWNHVVDAHSRWKLMAVISMRRMLAAVRLPTPCGKPINLMHVISTIQGSRLLLEKEIKNPQWASAEGSRERGWQLSSVHWMKVWPWSISQVSAWVSEGHKHEACSHFSSYREWFPACVVTASVQLVGTVLYKGRKNYSRIGLQWNSKRYIQKSCTSTEIQLSVKPVCGMLTRGRVLDGAMWACCMLHPAAAHPRASWTLLLFQGMQSWLQLWLSGKDRIRAANFHHAPPLLPADFLTRA